MGGDTQGNMNFNGAQSMNTMDINNQFTNVGGIVTDTTTMNGNIMNPNQGGFIIQNN